MDDLNMLHILAENVLHLGHGVRVVAQHDINSSTMVCFLDRKANFHYGFAYQNGSNLRVVKWQNGARRNKTVPHGSYIIAFNETTDKSFTDVFTGDDFNQAWFDNAAKDLVKAELLSLVDRKDEIEQIVEGLCDLTIGELQEVRKSIKNLKNPPINN